MDPLDGYRDQLADAIDRRSPSRARLALVVAVPLTVLFVAVGFWLRTDGSEPAVIESADEQSSTDPADIIGVDWYFTSIAFDDGRPIIDLSQNVSAFRLDGDGTYGVQACNHLSGEYELTGDGVITLTPGVQTDMGCGGTMGDADAVVSTELSGPVAWEVQGELLALRAPGVTASLRSLPAVFPDRLTALQSAGHPASEQYAIGYSGDPGGTQTIEILIRADPSQEFRSATVDSDDILVPAGLVASRWGTYVASWLPPDTAKAWVRLSTGGAEINLDLERLPNGRMLGWTLLPESAGEIVAFRSDGSEIDRSAPFDF
ncbi:META domain-containing protein [Actinospongicola halichondriae]|uniref:META domain-containing protein n=1 Tax=Actinospongicola halichondriae TaxID=3236844 RepID=UPI003D5968F2